MFSRYSKAETRGRRSGDGVKSINLMKNNAHPTRFVGVRRALVVFVVWVAALFVLRAALWGLGLCQ
jgi:hypothetical protein